MKKILFLLALFCTNCFASNEWICADQIKETSWGRQCELEKISVPTGWLVEHPYGERPLTFVYDPEHRWK